MRLPLSELDEKPGPYTMSFAFDAQALCKSIEGIGLVHAPCVARRETGQVDIVTGYRRIVALKALGWREVTCVDVSSVLRSALEGLLFAFHENLATRSFNPVEKAMALSRLAPLMTEQEILRRFMPLLDLPSHKETLHMYLRLAESGGSLQHAVAGGRLSMKAAALLMIIETGSAEAILEPLLNLNLNFNQQLQFIDLVCEIARIVRKDPALVLESDDMRSIFQNQSLNKPQKATRILQELNCLRNPRRRAAEKRFQSRVRSLGLPRGVRIDHPPFFEGPGYRLEMQFHNGMELRKKLLQLLELSGIHEFGDPLYEENSKDLS